MRALVIGPEERAATVKVVAYAMEPEHWYRLPLPEGGPVAGDNPNFVVTIPMGYRCVFTWTEHENRLWRHLTVSVDSDKYPSPEAVVEIARLFGFTGAEDEALPRIETMMAEHGWLMSIGHRGEHCIALAQALPGQES